MSKEQNKSKSTKILLIRDDLCFDQTTFLKKTQNFKLNNDFTSDISGQGNKLSLDNVEENDFCILRNAIDWETGDRCLKDTLLQTLGLCPKKAKYAFSKWKKDVVKQLDSAIGEAKKQKSFNDDEQKCFVYKWLF